MKASSKRSLWRRILLSCALAALLLFAGPPWGSRENSEGKELESLSRLSSVPATARSMWAGGGILSACASPLAYPELSGDQDADLSGIPGGDIAPVRYIMDPYPSFNGIAVDPENNRVVMSDSNRKSMLIYDRLGNSKSGEATQPLGQVMGPATQIGFITGVALDPVHREFYSVNNDTEDNMVVFSYDSAGNVKPVRNLAVPHRAWGVSVSQAYNEVAISVQTLGVVIYRREAQVMELPLRVITGSNTGMADPHGVSLDDVNDELVVANHGNWKSEKAVLASGTNYSGQPLDLDLSSVEGRFELPSIRTYPRTATGDAEPVRTIQGSKTQLDWPMEIDVDASHDEIAVANNGDHSILIFDRTDSGDVAPLRVIRGPLTGINAPMGVAVDTKNDEIWVANFGDHTALVFERTATGNVPPKRIIRNAPAGLPTSGFGNPMAATYDTKRREILVPN